MSNFHKSDSNENAVSIAESSVTLYLQERIAKIIGTSREKISKTKNIMEFGVDSIGLVALTDSIQSELQITLQPTVFFEYLNVHDLAKFLASDFKIQLEQYFHISPELKSKAILDAELEPKKTSAEIKKDKPKNSFNKNGGFNLNAIFDEFPKVEKQQTDATAQNYSEDIAVIGMAGQFADSPDLDTFWHNLVNQKNLFKSIPKDHFEYEDWCKADSNQSDNIYCTTGSFIDNVGDFDAAFFNISPKEAAILDPQLRLLMQVIYQTVEDAGYGAKIRGTNTGMYVGACFHDYEIELIRHMGEVSPYFGTGNALTMLANRPSYYLDLKGPSMPLDTACSASLVAINAAISALRQKECDMAFVAGTNLLLSPIHYRYFCALGALSKSGASYPFDSRADGYIPGEAVGAVLLKPLKQAQADGDRIHAVIKGAAVSHGGYSPSFTAPSVVQEAELIKKALRASNVTAESISYIEAHGTGTSLGDPIEINGLKLAFGSQTDSKDYCAIGTAKAHIGHAEGAAGIAGLLKVILSMKHKTIPAMPHFKELNPYVNLSDSPFYINRTNQHWENENNTPRRAGISSFGIGGAYAHVIVEEYPDAEVVQISDAESLFVLSAKSHDQLKTYAGKIADFLERQSGEQKALANGITVNEVQHKLKSIIANLLHEDVHHIDENALFIDSGIDIEAFIQLTKIINDTYRQEFNLQQVAQTKRISRLASFIVKHINTKATLAVTNEDVPRLNISLQDIAYTMQVGREAMPVRMAIIAKNKNDLLLGLRDFIDAKQGGNTVVSNANEENNRLVDFFNCEEGNEFIVQLLKGNRLYQLAQLWVSGINIHWAALQDNQHARIISLPTYPFAKKRYWFTDEYSAKPAIKNVETRILSASLPATIDTRSRLEEIWRKHLSIDKLQDSNGFIELGGNSITTVQVVTEINKVFGIAITNSEFMREATFGAVVNLVNINISNINSGAPVSHSDVQIAQIPVSEEKNNYSLSKDQMRLWVLAQMYPSNTRHNISSAYQLQGNIDLQLLQTALNLVAQENLSLKTKFVEKSGQVIQSIDSEYHILISAHSLEHLSAAEQKPAVIDYIRSIALTPFNLAVSPLVRVTAIKLSATTSILSIVAHHIVADIRSIDILATELLHTYTNGAQSIVKKPTQFGDYANWMGARATDNAYDKQIGYWKNQLAQAPLSLSLPFDYPRQEKQTFSAAQYQFSIANTLYISLDALAKKLNSTRFSLCFAAFNIMLNRICAQKDILIGVPSENRRHTETRDMMGFLANTLILRTKIEDDEKILDIAARVKDDIYSAFDNQEVSYGDIVQQLGIVPPKNHNPLFQVLFNMVERSSSLFNADDIRLDIFDIGLVTLDFDLLFTLEIRDDRMFGFMDYNPDLFKQSTIVHMTESFVAVLQQFANAESSKSAISVADLKIPQINRTLTNTATENPLHDLLVISSFTAEPIEDTLKFWIEELSLNYAVKFSPYNQVFQQLLDPSLELLNNQNGSNLLLVRYDDWVRFDTTLSVAERQERKKGVLIEFINALTFAANKLLSPLVLLTPPSDNVQDKDLHSQFDKQVAAACENFNNLFYVDLQQVDAQYPVQLRFDAIADKAGHIPFSSSYFTALGTAAIRRLASNHINPYKVIVLDCDNTLWQGVVGEAGVNGIVIDNARKSFQQFLIQQQQQGVLLCLASKNNEDDALAVFKQRDDVPLKMEHLVSWKINWEPKSKNIADLAHELNLGLDSFIFIDDNPVECAEVKAAYPEVLTLQFPQDPAQIMLFSQNIWGLEKRVLTKEDQQRTEMYRNNVERQRIENASDNFADFIRNLDLKISIDPLNENTVDRVEQLMLRTNQFNSTTRRYDIETIKSKLPHYACHTVSVSDRFGDYGLVGVLLHSIEAEELVLDSFLLSCRVLGKGVEHAMLQFLGKQAQAQGVANLALKFIKTEKNVPVENFFNSISGASWNAQAASYLVLAAEAVGLEFVLSKRRENENIIHKPRLETSYSRIKSGLARIPSEHARLSDIEAAIARFTSSNIPTIAAETGRHIQQADGQLEASLLKVYCKVLNKDKISTDVSFFDLGGNSLLLVKLASLLKEELDLDLMITDLFKYPSVSVLAKYLDNKKPKTTTVNKNRLRASMQRDRIKNMLPA